MVLLFHSVPTQSEGYWPVLARLTKTDQDQTGYQSKLKEENSDSSKINQGRFHIQIFPKKKYFVGMLVPTLKGLPNTDC